MNKINIILLILIGILSVLAFIKLSPGKKDYVIIRNHTFHVDIAKTEIQKEKGLSIYSSIKDDEGMIFPYSIPGYYAYWMLNMKFPIDIIFIRNNRIVDVFRNVRLPKSPDEFLPTYKTRSLADTVLEIKAGLSDKYKFRIGDNVIIKYK